MFPGWFYEIVSHICDEYNANSLCSYKKDHNSNVGFMLQIQQKNDGMIEIHHITIHLKLVWPPLEVLVHIIFIWICFCCYSSIAYCLQKYSMHALQSPKVGINSNSIDLCLVPCITLIKFVILSHVILGKAGIPITLRLHELRSHFQKWV